jgi:hypothetical protein
MREATVAVAAACCPWLNSARARSFIAFRRWGCSTQSRDSAWFGRMRILPRHGARSNLEAMTILAQGDHDHMALPIEAMIERKRQRVLTDCWISNRRLKLRIARRPMRSRVLRNALWRQVRAGSLLRTLPLNHAIKGPRRPECTDPAQMCSGAAGNARQASRMLIAIKTEPSATRLLDAKHGV